MTQQKTALNSVELACLWSAYMSDNMVNCYLTYFREHVQDEEIKALVQEAFTITENHFKFIGKLFQEEQIAIPHGYGANDLNLPAPVLFDESFAISFVYGMARIGLGTYGLFTSGVSRQDIIQFFSQCLANVTKLNSMSMELLLKRGLYDPPPTIPYPEKVEFVDKQRYLTGWFGKRRAMQANELMDIFFNIERIYLGLNMLIGFIQVTEDEEVKDFFIRGKTIAEKQIGILNDLLKEEDLFGVIQTRVLVSTSTVSPFSPKLMLALINSLNAAQISYLGVSLSKVMRRDLAAHYSRLLTEVLQYAEDGLNLMINRGWLEQPPQAANRRELAKV